MAKVGIDIGHGENTWSNGGGKGIRKNGKDYEEHHFNSAVAIIVEKRLQDHGIGTYMAQKPYKNDVALSTRTRNYNAQNVDLVVSIHANAGVSTANGGCAFYWHTSSSSKRLAQIFMKHWNSTVKGVDQFGTGAIASVPNTWTNFHMCRETAMESILVECGFMTSPNDFEYIFGSKKGTYIPQVAEAIVKAVCEYLGVKYKGSTSNAPAKAPEAPEVTPSGHKVQAGDTLYSIARKYGVDLNALQKANPNVNASTLKIGSYLTIPKASKPAPKEKYPLPTGVLRKGSKGESVKQLQRALNAVNFNCGNVDGVYGANTEDAVRRFQKVYDAYNVDGIYGSRTRERLNNLLN